MATITEINERWHESLQILWVLRTGLLDRTELCERVAKNQKKIIVDYERSKSTCRYWINNHLKDGKIREHGSLLELTRLGTWIVESNIGSMENRNYFIDNYVCWKCRPSSTVLYDLEPDTAVTNKKGDTFMNVKCPRCSNSIERHRSTGREFNLVEESIYFYNKAKEELRRLGIID